MEVTEQKPGFNTRTNATEFSSLRVVVSLLFLALSQIGGQVPVSLGLAFSPHSSWLINEDNFKNRGGISYKITYGGSAGLTFGLHLSESWMIETRVIYSKQGQDYYLSPSKIQNGFCLRRTARILKVRLEYLKIPLLVKYKVGMMARHDTSFLFGLTVNHLLDPQDNYQELLACKILLPGPESRYRESEIGGIIGVEYDQTIVTHLSFQAALEVEASLSRAFIAPDEPDYVYKMYHVLDNLQRSRNLVVGLRFGFRLTP